MKCVVGLSGGVDSAVSAALMIEQGVEVVSCTLKMFDTPASVVAIDDARRIANFFKIPHEVIDCVDVFKHSVMNYFVESYENGHTPNPCVMCNKYVKFQYLNEFRKHLQADCLVTGHYAQLSQNGDKINLSQAADLSRDQSYFLYRVPRDILKCAIFPLGKYSKQQVRQMAKTFGIHVADKGDSQDICFLNNESYTDFIKRNSHNAQIADGDIVDECGKVLGRHKGTINYTIGQRKGLGLAGGPYFVCEINPKENLVVVSDKSRVQKDKIILSSVVFINEEWLGDCHVKIRSSNKMVPAKICKNSDKYYVQLYQPECGIAEGQHCVFFHDRLVIGGGIITR